MNNCALNSALFALCCCSEKCGFPLAEERNFRKQKRKTFFSHTAGSMGSKERGRGSSGHMAFLPFFFFPPCPPFRVPFTFASSPLRAWNRLGPKRGNRRIRCEKEKDSLFRGLFTLKRLSIWCSQKSSLPRRRF